MERGDRQMVYTQKQLADVIAPIAQKYRIPLVYLFGSYAKGTATEDSDIDLLIDTKGTEIKSLLQLSAVMLELENATGKRIDLITTSSFDQKTDRISTLHFRDAVRRERLELYALS